MWLKLTGLDGEPVLANVGPGTYICRDMAADPKDGIGSRLWGASDDVADVKETAEEIWAMLEPERVLLDLALTQARISLATLDKCDAAIDALGPKPAKRPKAEPAECPECGCEWPEVMVGCLGCQVRMNAAGF